jgi:hypothetical protein
MHGRVVALSMPNCERFVVKRTREPAATRTTLGERLLCGAVGRFV